ncbi:MAG: ABC transporter permease [Bryobacteraceae bacterium]
MFVWEAKMSEIKLAIRKLSREPGMVIAAVIALGFGLGINTAVFTLVNAVLIRGLPFPDSGRIVYMVTERPDRNQSRSGLSLAEFREYREQTKVFDTLAAHWDGEFNVSDPQQPPERYRGGRITANAFSITSVRPMLGREFTASDEQPGAPRVVMLGHRVWQNRYGSDPDIVGKAVRIEGEQATVVGVMPPGFRFPVGHDLWMPLRTNADLEKRGNRWLGVFGRVEQGKAMADARAEAAVIGERIRAAWPKEQEGVVFSPRTFNEQFNGGNIQAVFLLMLGAVAFVVLIVCANVTNLLLARSLSRTREMALRMAMGASRWLIVRQLLVESLVLGALGGLAGLTVAWAGVRAFSAAVADVGKPYWIDFSFDPVVFVWLAGLCIGSAILFGLAPALRLSRVDLNGSLKEGERGSGGSRRARWFTGAMVTAQLALALVLLVGSGLMVTSAMRASDIGAGLDTGRWLSGRLNLPQVSYEKPESRVRLLEQALERVRAIPGVEAAAVASGLPLFGASGWRFEIEGQTPVDDEKWPAVDGVTISDGYFETVGKKILRGREVAGLDGTPGRQVVVVNDAFAQRYFPNQDPVGRRIRLQLDDRPWLTIAGIAPNIRTDPRRNDRPEPAVYLPYRQSPGRFWTIFVRADPSALDSVAVTLRKEIQVLDPDLPVANVKAFRETLRESNWALRVFSTIFSIFAGFALLLAAVGLYAVISYFVNQRTREIGIRMAMGAGTGAILGWALRHGLVPLGVGLALGMAGGAGVGRLLESTRLLLGTTSFDPVTLLGVALLLGGTSLLALWIPARRASRVDPLVALRHE